MYRIPPEIFDIPYFGRFAIALVLLLLHMRTLDILNDKFRWFFSILNKHFSLHCVIFFLPSAIYIALYRFELVYSFIFFAAYVLFCIVLFVFAKLTQDRRSEKYMRKLREKKSENLDLNGVFVIATITQIAEFTVIYKFHLNIREYKGEEHLSNMLIKYNVGEKYFARTLLDNPDNSSMLTTVALPDVVEGSPYREWQPDKGWKRLPVSQK